MGITQYVRIVVSNNFQVKYLYSIIYHCLSVKEVKTCLRMERAIIWDDRSQSNVDMSTFLVNAFLQSIVIAFSSVT